MTSSLNEDVWGIANIGIPIDRYDRIYNNIEALAETKYSKYWVVIGNDHYKAILKEEARDKVQQHLGIPLTDSHFGYMWMIVFKYPRKKFPWGGALYSYRKVNSLTYCDIIDSYYSMTYQDGRH